MDEVSRVGLAGLRMGRGRKNSGRWFGCCLQRLQSAETFFWEEDWEVGGMPGAATGKRVPNYILLRIHPWLIYTIY